MNRSELCDIPLTQLRFVALDFEATGAAPGHDRIIEIGAASFRVLSGGRVAAGATYQQLVNPARRLSPMIERLTGLRDDMLASAPTIEGIWDVMSDFIADHSPDSKTVILAHKAQSDLHFLAAAARRLGRPLQSPAFVCTLNISRHIFPQAPSHRLGQLVRWLECSPRDGTWHRALPDALHTRNLFERAIRESQARTLGELGVRRPEPIPAPDHFDIAVPAHLVPVVGAIEAGHAVSVIYRGGSKGKQPRSVTPMAFYNHAGRLWLRALCHHDSVVKSFRCDRLRLHKRAGAEPAAT